MVQGTVGNATIAAMLTTLGVSMLLPVIVLIVFALKNKQLKTILLWQTRSL